MPKFRVQLDGLAHVRQIQYIEAESKDAAIEKALDTDGDYTWEYRGIQDNSIVTQVEFDSMVPASTAAEMDLDPEGIGAYCPSCGTKIDLGNKAFDISEDGRQILLSQDIACPSCKINTGTLWNDWRDVK